MSMAVIVIFNAFDDSLPMKWKPDLILRIFEYIVNYVKSRIIYLSLLFFTAVTRMALQPYTFMM